MRLAALAIAFVLVGCVTAQEAGRSVAQSQAGAPRMSVLERSKAHAQKWGLPHELPDRVAEIAQRIFDANEDICGRSCETPITYWPASSSQTTYREIQIGGHAADSTDGKVAQNISHELAHVFLGHTKSSQPAYQGDTRREDDADCVGAVFATRAGFEVESAALAYLENAEKPDNRPRDWASRYSSYSVAAGIVRNAHRKTRALMDAGKPIDKAAIKEICGVTW